MPLVFGSICSGIGAPEMAWTSLGWRCAFMSEIEPFPRAVLSHHYPEVPLHGDFTTIQAGEYASIDLLCGGTPCQSFSVAGLRGGLADERGNLALEYLRLADRLRPRWLVWENVPGVLSSGGGRDFGAFLGALGECGYGFAYRVLDAQYFGLAQRRKRVFVVGHLGDWRPAAAVLFEPASLRGDPAPRREAGEGVARPTAAGAPGSSGYRNDADTADNLIPAISPALKARDYKGPSSDGDGDGAPLIVAHTLRAEDFDASEDGTGRGVPLVPVAFDTTQITSAGNYSNPQPGDPCHPLAARAHPPAIAFNSREDPCCTGAVTGALGSSSPQAQAVAFSAKDHGADAGALAPTLRAMGHAGSHPNGGGQVAVAFMENQRGELRVSDQTDSLTAGGGKPGQGYASALVGSAVRRPTPRECERLMGFPDDYTLIPYRRGMAADGPRYKALGNSMAVPVLRWIGRRIMSVAQLQNRG